MLFLYSGVSKTGEVVKKGTINATTKEEARKQLKANGYKITTLKQQNLLTKDITIRKRLTKAELAFFCRILYFFVDAGVSFSSLNTIATTGRVKQELETLQKHISKGESIYNALILAKFPTFMCSMVKIGEETGRLPLILNKLEQHYEKENASSKEMVSILIYPTIVMIMMMMIVSITMIYLVPSFSQMFVMHNIYLPPVTIALINFSNFVVNNALSIALVMLVLLLIIFKTKQTLIFKAPFVKKLTRLVYTSRFTSTMAIMIDAGIPILTAIAIVSKLFNNKHYVSLISSIQTNIKSGTSLSISLQNTNFFDPLLISMVILGEQTGTLPKSLEKSSTYFEKEQQILFSRLKKQIEPALTIVMGGILLFIMLAIMLPTITLMGVV
jgi:type IV pilus assembly protein PilC